MKKFFISFLNILFRWLPLIFAFFALLCYFLRDSSAFDINQKAFSLASSGDPVVVFAVCAGAFGWSFVCYVWYYLLDLISFVVGLFCKSFGNKSVDQKEV